MVVADVAAADRFGIGWRPELAAGILANRDRLDVVEVIIEAYLAAGRARRARAAHAPASIPVVLHGVSLGLASIGPVEEHRLRGVAVSSRAVGPPFWSEHFAYVRGGGPKWDTWRTVAIGHHGRGGGAQHPASGRTIVGAVPAMENVATLIDPPGSDMNEPGWIGEVVSQAPCGLLLDLHNVYTNCVNAGGDPYQFVADLPAGSIQAIHLAGGQLIEEPRLGDTRRRGTASSTITGIPYPRSCISC